jgi:ribosomal protein S18 acetylase RimI-like enzyme
VRRAVVSDLGVILDLYAHLHLEDPLVSADRAEEVWRRIMSDEFRVVFVADLCGQVVGTAEAWVVPNLTRSARPIGIVENVVVRREFRRRGIGRQLIDAVVGHLEFAGCYKAQVVAMDDAALSFYRSVGFLESSVALKRLL